MIDCNSNGEKKSKGRTQKIQTQIFKAIKKDSVKVLFMVSIYSKRKGGLRNKF